MEGKGIVVIMEKGSIKNFIYGFGIAILFLLAILLLLPPLAGWNEFVVVSESMEPAYHRGDIVIVKQCTVDQTKEGDVISFFDRSGVVTTHRIEGYSLGRIITKGDANEEVDGFYVQEDNLIGKVIIRVPYIGNISLWIKSLRY